MFIAEATPTGNLKALNGYISGPFWGHSQYRGSHSATTSAGWRAVRVSLRLNSLSRTRACSPIRNQKSKIRNVSSHSHVLHITDAPFPNLLNLLRDIEGVVSLVPKTSPCRPRTSSRRFPSTDPLAPATSVGFLAFPGISLGRVGKPGVGVRPRKRVPRSSPVLARPGCVSRAGSREPSVGFLAFPGISLGCVGKPGGGVVPSRIIFLDNFRADSAARAQISALSTRLSELGTGLPTCNFQPTTYNRFLPSYLGLFC